VWLEKDNGHATTIDLAKLSTADREYVTKRLSVDPVTPDAPPASPDRLNASENQPRTLGKVFHLAALQAAAEPVGSFPMNSMNTAAASNTSTAAAVVGAI